MKKIGRKKRLLEQVERTINTSGKIYSSFKVKDNASRLASGKGIIHTHTENGGKMIGKVIGAPITFVGERTKKAYIADIGESVQNASTHAGNITGQLLQGTAQSGFAILAKDKNYLSSGVNDLKQGFTATGNAAYNSIAFTLKNSNSIIQGIYEQDTQKLQSGAKGLGKVIIVGGLTFTLFDIIGGDNVAEAQTGDLLATQNSHLIDQPHPETGVIYEAQLIELPNGEEVMGVFPVFEPAAEIQLPQNLYESSDYTHFSFANTELLAMVENDPSLAANFTSEQLAQIQAGETPDNYTWHHHEQSGKLQLVDEETHAQSGHSGGRAIWGGGSNAR